MAHFMKSNKGNYKRIAKEAYRELEYYKNDVDKERTDNNICTPNYEQFKTLTEQFLKNHPIKRKDQAIIINEVITRPQALKEADTATFYKEVMKYTSKTLNANTAYICIHNDEYTQHAHIAFYAFNKDKDKWDCKNMLNRTFLENYHKGLNEYIDNILGYHIEIEKDHKTEHLTHEEYKQEMKKKREKEK